MEKFYLKIFTMLTDHLQWTLFTKLNWSVTPVTNRMMSWAWMIGHPTTFEVIVWNCTSQYISFAILKSGSSLDDPGK